MRFLLIPALCSLTLCLETRQTPPQEAAEQKTVARRALAENCLICHGPELIQSQRLTAKQWEAEVDKMTGWGSPLPAEMRKPLIEFLTAEYPSTTVAPAPERVERAAAEKTVGLQPDPASLATASADRGGPLYVKHCANCHGADGQGSDLGPNLVEKPVLARPGDFIKVVREGSGRMPAFNTVLDESACADMIAWVRGRTYVPPAVPGVAR